ncbi:glycosyltransferase [Candidatus Bathyarchaeota archaeon]|nr:glycosyltransferase [Candidatus Bathyarchaeota archaeon]
MKIAVVSQNMCMRATQTSLVSKARGHSVYLVVHQEAKVRQFDSTYDSMSYYITKDQMLCALKELKPDLIHVHDRPHRIAFDVIGAKLGVPVVHDLHDMFSMLVPNGYHPDDSPFEDTSIKGADGLVFVTETNKAWAEKRWGPLPPSVVVPSGVMSQFYPAIRFPLTGAGVWGGGAYVEPEASARFYIDQRPIIQRFLSVGQPTVVYHAPADPGVPEQYEAAGAIMGGVKNYLVMLQEYSKFEFGWYGQVTDHGQIHDTLPNKLFEYLAAGIPVVVINATTAGEFVEKHGVGIHIRRPEDIVWRKDELPEIRARCWTKRYEFTREKCCESMWPLYEKLTGVKANA